MIKMTHRVTKGGVMIPKPLEIIKSESKKYYLGFYSLDDQVTKHLMSLKMRKGKTQIETQTCEKGYIINLDETISIAYENDEHLFYALVTLKSLVDKEIQMAQIIDCPNLHHRGLMLDVARHFYSKDVIFSLLDLCAELKLNVFHLHLTDDQGWRLESKIYPKLHEVGSIRKQTKRRFRVKNQSVEGYYTADDIKEIVQYAKERFIEVVPEIDLPGHFSAAIASYPNLSCRKEKKEVVCDFGIFEDILCVGVEENRQFIFDILDEVIDLFQCKRIHLGCDEVPLSHWKNCESCQTYMKSMGCLNEKTLFLYQIQTWVEFCKRKGTKVVIWNDPLKFGSIPNVQIQHWMHRKVTQTYGIDNEVINSDYFHTYFDYPHYMTPLDKTLKADVLNHSMVIGYEGCLWTEHVDSVEKLFEMIMPRLLAISEISWTKTVDSCDFNERVEEFLSRYHGYYTMRYNEKGIFSVLKTLIYMIKMVSYHDIKNIFRMR